MEALYNFDRLRTNPDVVLIVIDETNTEITRRVSVNKMLLIAVSESFERLFSPKDLSLEDKDLKREVRVADVNLFSELVDSFYIGNTNAFIKKARTKDALVLLCMCDKFAITSISYMDIIKDLKPSGSCFRSLIDILTRRNQVKEDNIELIARWVSSDTDLSVLQDKEFAKKLARFTSYKFLIASNNGSVQVFNGNGKLLREIEIKSSIRSITVSRFLGIAAICDREGEIHIISTGTQSMVQRLSYLHVVCLSFSRNRKMLAVYCSRGIMRIWDVKNSHLENIIKRCIINMSENVEIVWDRNDERIAIGDKTRGGIVIIHVHSNTVISKLIMPPCLSIKFFGDGSIMYACHASIGILLTNECSSIESDLKDNSPFHAVDISDDGNELITVDSVGTVKVWNYRTKKVLYTKIHASAPILVRLSPDAKTAIIGYQDGLVFMWNLESGSGDMIRLEGIWMNLVSIEFFDY